MYMCSGFQAREFGLGCLIPEAVLQEINTKREGHQYQSKKEAKIIYNMIEKKKIIDNPTRRFFRSGANHEGFWTAAHAKLQLEDVADVLQTLYPAFDFLFLFDQSSGHTKMREDGLNTSEMNVSYGGAQKKMRDGFIHQKGTYQSAHCAGPQRMHFVDQDDGPFWMTPDEKAATKYDRTDGTTQRKEKTKAQLLINLRARGVDTTKKRYLKPELIQMCHENNISIIEDIAGVIPGWVGKPKGMLQVLYERGMIDPSLVTSPNSMRYSKEGRRNEFDDNGELNELGKQFLLKYLLNSCTDFKNEVTDLEQLAKDIL